MAQKQNKQALNRRAEKRNRRALMKKAQARRASDDRLAGGLNVASPFLLGLPKLSAVIWEFAEPLTDAAVGAEGQKRAAQIAIVCWNAALLPADKGKEALALAVRDISGGDQTVERGLYDVLDMMLERKRRYFADDHRFVLDFSLTDTDEGVHLMVASSPLSPAEANAAFPSAASGSAPGPLPQLTNHQPGKNPES